MNPSRVLVGSIACLVVACGSSIDRAIFDEEASPVDAGSTDLGVPDAPPVPVETGEAVPDTAPPADATEESAVDAAIDSGPAPTIETVCARLQDAVCGASLRTCCATRALEWKEAECRKRVDESCRRELEDVRNGRGSYEPSAFAACAAAYEELARQCTTTRREYARLEAACFQLFPGTAMPGTRCDRDTDCRVEPGTVGRCENRVCFQVGFAGKGERCDTAGSVRISCDPDSYCRTDATGATCVAAKAIGENCQTSAECGAGNYCPVSSPSGGRCAVAGAVGTSCRFETECASGDCADRRCTDPVRSIATRALCNGG
jgi:hypothetical protein